MTVPVFPVNSVSISSKVFAFLTQITFLVVPFNRQSSILTVAPSDSTQTALPSPELLLNVHPFIVIAVAEYTTMAAPLPAVLFPSNAQFSNVTETAPEFTRIAEALDFPSVLANFTFLTVKAALCLGQKTPALFDSEVFERPLNVVWALSDFTPSRIISTTPSYSGKSKVR